jgi:hypothetical protein
MRLSSNARTNKLKKKLNVRVACLVKYNNKDFKNSLISPGEIFSLLTIAQKKYNN